MRIKISNEPKFVRRRVLVAVWGSVLVAQVAVIIPLLAQAMDNYLGL